MFEAVVIGTSAGGINALKTVLGELSADFPLPVLIVQHLPGGGGADLPAILNGATEMTVKMAEDKERIEGGVVYIAPANYHLLVEEERTLALSVDEPVNWSRPAIDVLFESAADCYGDGLIGVILTGANSDGSSGIRAVKGRGGYAVVEDPSSAEVAVMPLAALSGAPVDRIASVGDVGSILAGLARRSGHPETTNSLEPTNKRRLQEESGGRIG